MSLEIATEADIPAIMAIERLPGYDWFIGTFEANEHLDYMRSTDAKFWSGAKAARCGPSSSCSR